MHKGKRKCEDENVAETPKKLKLSEDSSISAVSDKEIDWKLLNGYLLWLNMINRHREKISKELLQPVVDLIQKIKLEDLTNVWFNSTVLFDLLNQSNSYENVKITKATSFEPKIGGIAYKTASLENFDINTTIDELDCIDSSVDSSDDSDEPDLIKYIVKVVHIKQCSIEKIIGNSSKECEMYNSLLGLEPTTTSENENSEGWIINPQWINICSVNKHNAR